MKLLTRIFFAIRFQTLKRIIPGRGEDAAFIHVYHQGKITKLNRRCPHQGGKLDQGYIQGDNLHCPWHGCRFSLTGIHVPQAYVPVPCEETKRYPVPRRCPAKS